MKSAPQRRADPRAAARRAGQGLDGSTPTTSDEVLAAGGYRRPGKDLRREDHARGGDRRDQEVGAARPRRRRVSRPA
ncbi:MAG: hypothetical protein MZW92_16925 [Comamonadaceae bacterium]|nr:hypothetical protein [Comamonadaceae bacterium]